MKYLLTMIMTAVVLILSPAPGMSEEKLNQEKISIMGNRGLPKTLYIAPWKRLGGPLEGDKPEGSIEQETDPVEQDLLHRELELHREGYSVD